MSRTSLSLSEVSRSGESGHGSRASGTMNLFGIRRRDQSRSRSPQSAFNDDVFVRSSAPSYVRSNSGYESVPSSSRKPAAARTTPMTPGASYAPPLSALPAPVFYMHPNYQQGPTSQSYSEHKNYGGHGHANQVYLDQAVPASPYQRVPYQQQYSSPYYPPPSSNVHGWQQQAGYQGHPIPYSMSHGSIPTPQPVPAVSVSGSRRSAAHSVSRKGSRSVVNEDKSPTPAVRRQRTEKHEEHTHGDRSPRRSRDRSHRRSRHGSRDRSQDRLYDRLHEGLPRNKSHRGSHRKVASESPQRRAPSPKVTFRRYSDLSRKLRLHICYGCGRVRSESFQSANPFHRDKRPLLNFCGKCRGSNGFVPAE